MRSSTSDNCKSNVQTKISYWIKKIKRWRLYERNWLRYDDQAPAEQYQALMRPCRVQRKTLPEKPPCKVLLFLYNSLAVLVLASCNIGIPFDALPLARLIFRTHTRFTLL